MANTKIDAGTLNHTGSVDQRKKLVGLVGSNEGNKVHGFSPKDEYSQDSEYTKSEIGKGTDSTYMDHTTAGIVDFSKGGNKTDIHGNDHIAFSGREGNSMINPYKSYEPYLAEGAVSMDIPEDKNGFETITLSF